MPPWSGDPGRARGLSRHLRGAAHLAATGIRVGRKRVALLMSAAGIAGVSRRKFVTTTAKGSDRQAPDLVDRNFTAARPNLLWVADITYIPTWAGFLYLAVVLDAYSRRLEQKIALDFPSHRATHGGRAVPLCAAQLSAADVDAVSAYVWALGHQAAR
jgi:transposase InsO family protein